MRKIVVLCVLVMLTNVLHAQRNKSKKTDNQENTKSSLETKSEVPLDTMYMRMYRNGMKYGDYRLALTAFHSLYALHPDRIDYLDSTALLYAQTQNYAQCILTGREVLKSIPNDLHLISAMAVSEQQLGRYEEALAMFQKEYDANSSIYASYQIAVLQYTLQRLGEAQATLDRLILNPEAMKQQISFSTGASGSQNVFYKAAAENLMGVIYKDLKENDKAIARFKRALQIQPDFVLAQNNLDYLTKSNNPDNTQLPPKTNTKTKTK